MRGTWSATIRGSAALAVALIAHQIDMNSNAQSTADGVQPNVNPARFTYPPARKADVVDNYHGTLVADPYRWLEDPDSEETRAWVEAQNAITMPFLEAIPARVPIRERLTQLWNYERWGVPYKEANRYFVSKNDGLQNQAVLYTTESLDGDLRVLLDPNLLSEKGTVALSGLRVSHDGRLMAYGLASAGSDWNEWKVRDVATGEDLEDRLEWIKFSGASWSTDNQGFAYTRYPTPDPNAKLEQVNYFAKLYYHRVGTSQDQDLLLYERPEDKEWRPSGEFTEDGRYLVVTISKGTDAKYKVFVKDLEKGGLVDSPAVELVGDFDAEYSLIDNDGSTFFFKTNKDAPLGRVVAIDLTNPSPEHWREIIPEAAETLEGVSLTGGRFFASYLKDARTQVKVYGLDGTFEREVELPGIGTASGFGGKKDSTETFYAFSGFTTPGTIYRYDIATGQSTIFKAPRLTFNPEEYVTEQVFYTSKDGTTIPMFISYRKGLVKDGSNPTYLYGYGGFNISLTPTFSPANLAWMEMGGVLAIPNLRGGGEYGETWHQAGTKLNKQNVFDDFIAAAQWLIAQGYTSTPKLAIGGGSNGGLLVGACMTQRPDLFGAALPAVGVMDMLRFHLFTIGWAWKDDYGSSEDPELFQALFKYSPLHNIKPGTCYPATLITTADHDDRVVPAHSFKFAAALQAAQSCDKPTLIRIEVDAGHGAGKPTSKTIEEIADRWAFLVKVLDFTPTIKL
ncbi:prolyl oligopeptidase [Isosphaera pallida ATCC 43644]|uniref:prolyl oligopeptidase n=1 Tax=Isosphaera pallida (strain ATCC 43644 / DSM 9630 / IS1B) TaxID=575540 RepID=E8R5W3_ISOPI|nr:prolyl oligopeptidase family serine peptidase [Isosphaera pallida]ADV62870.1 prolyl oligopeptidase [Isosphaera pallida ATCC 43644]